MKTKEIATTYLENKIKSFRGELAARNDYIRIMGDKIKETNEKLKIYGKQ